MVLLWALSWAMNSAIVTQITLLGNHLMLFAAIALWSKVARFSLVRRWGD